jgi:hypothetical protein
MINPPTINISKWSFSHFSTDFSRPAIDTNDLASTARKDNIFVGQLPVYLDDCFFKLKKLQKYSKKMPTPVDSVVKNLAAANPFLEKTEGLAKEFASLLDFSSASSTWKKY